MKYQEKSGEAAKGSFTALRAAILPATLNMIVVEKKDDLASLVAACTQDDFAQLVFSAPIKFSDKCKRFLFLVMLQKQLKFKDVKCHLLGGKGELEKPELLLKLSRQVLCYANTVTFRFDDSPFRSFLKKIIALLPGSFLWSGFVVLAVMRDPKLNVNSRLPLSGECFDFLTLFSADRQVSFLFRTSDKWPFAVRKSGALEDLTNEYRKHCQALKWFDSCVPSIVSELECVSSASFSLEYVPEYTLINRVAEVWSDRQTSFVRESQGHLDFCLQIYRRWLKVLPVQSRQVTKADVEALLADFVPLLCESSGDGIAPLLLNGVIGITLPLIGQHGDFCVRNVLITGGERGRVLIDWEDMQEQRWPLVDFALLVLSLKEVYADLFKTDIYAIQMITEIAEGIESAKNNLMQLLGLDEKSWHAALMLSLASLCRQNLQKNRLATAKKIYAELLRQNAKSTF